MRISLLHATYRAGAPAVSLRDEWIAAASEPDRIEYIFACDSDDEISMACPELAGGVVGAPMLGVSAVRNWNAAASRATGDLLFAIADDLHPPSGWDAEIQSVIRCLDPRRAAFVVKVKDSPDDTSQLIRHPLISRRYYERHGLWCPEYQGHFVDNDFTFSANRRNVVIDGRNIEFDHRHHIYSADMSDSHTKMETSRDEGRQLLAARWPMWKRRMIRRPLRPTADQVKISAAAQIGRASLSRIGYVLGLVPQKQIERLKSVRR